MKAVRLVWAHFLKDYQLEAKDGKLLSQLLVYMAASVFVCFIAFQSIKDINTWVALYWLIVLFGAFQVCGRTFDRDGEGRTLWLHFLSPSKHIILAKLLFNILIMLLLAIVTFILFKAAFGASFSESFPYLQVILAVVAGALALGAALTLISSISFKAGNAMALSSILGFPVILPSLLIMVKLLKSSLQGMSLEATLPYHLALWALAVLGIGLSYLLFPYFWRD